MLKNVEKYWYVLIKQYLQIKMNILFSSQYNRKSQSSRIESIRNRLPVVRTRKPFDNERMIKIIYGIQKKKVGN